MINAHAAAKSIMLAKLSMMETCNENPNQNKIVNCEIIPQVPYQTNVRMNLLRVSRDEAANLS